MNKYDNPIPGIDVVNTGNPTIYGDDGEFRIQFLQTRESLSDPVLYRRFVDNAVASFRKSRAYTMFKAHMYDNNLGRCQIFGNVTSEMCSIEMHHVILSLDNIAVILTEHTLNTRGFINTFELIRQLRYEHIMHRVALVMLSVTSHNVCESSNEFFIHPKMVHPDFMNGFVSFIRMYADGITPDIAYRLLFYFKRALRESETTDNHILDVYEKIADVSRHMNICVD
jgi:hypothetical protein